SARFFLGRSALESGSARGTGARRPTDDSPADHMGDADLLEAFETEFETEAGLLHAAEENPRIHGSVLVDPRGSGRETGSDAPAGVEIRAPHRGAEPDLEAVGPFDGLVEIRVLDDRQHGPELLLGDE